MKEFFKHKKVIVTGERGWKYDWITSLLQEWEADMVITTQDIKHVFMEEQPEIVFHISGSKDRGIEVGEGIVSPYVGTSSLLDAIHSVSSVQSAVVIPEDTAHNNPEWNHHLNDEEKKELAHLLEKAENVEIRGEIWHQLVKKFITVPIELCILNEENKVFLVYRNDREFDGYHMPGTVINDWEKVEEACKRLIRKEVTEGAGLTITEPISIGWLEVRRGDKPEESKTRNAISLLHVAKVIESRTPFEGAGFYGFDELPENTLGHHKYILRFFKRYLSDGKIILGK